MLIFHDFYRAEDICGTNCVARSAIHSPEEVTVYRGYSTPVHSGIERILDWWSGTIMRSQSIPPFQMTATTLYSLILNYNGGEDTVNCITALIDSGFPEGRIIVVDNNSSDDSLELIAAHFSGIQTIESATNLGYAGGNNLGIECAIRNGAGAILVLNNDVIVGNDTVAMLLRFIEEREDVGVIGPLILAWGTDDLVESAGAKIRWYRGDSKPLERGKHVSQIQANPSEVDYVSGCAMLISRTAIERVGLFPPQFFMYCEEEDFCIRVSKTGLKTVCLPSAKAWHKGGLSVSKNPGSRQFYEMRNRFMIMKRHAGVHHMMSFLGFWFLAEIMYYALREEAEGCGMIGTCSRIRGGIKGLVLFICENRLTFN